MKLIARLIPTLLILSIIAINGLATNLRAAVQFDSLISWQGPNRDQEGPNRDKEDPFGPNRPRAEAGEVTVTKLTRSQQPRAPRQNAYLALFTEPAKAQVSLLRSGGRGRPLKSNSVVEGVHIFSKLPPGEYALRIVLEDHETIEKPIKLRAGDELGYVARLKSKIGTVALAMGDQAAPDVVVTMDGVRLPAERVKIEKEMIYLLRTPIGPHRLEIAKPRHIGKSWEKFEVKPGEAVENTLPVNLEPATIAVTVKSVPGARIYVDDEDKGVVNSEGLLLIPELFPGPRKLRVDLFGYETRTQTLTLSLDNRAITEEIKLISEVETAEGSDEFNAEKNNWYSAQPLKWSLTPGIGRTIRGDEVALLKGVTKPFRAFGIYGDFTMLFRVRFENGKGAAWVVRARDEQNYYLFELTPDFLTFSVYQNGQRKELKRNRVTVNLRTPKDDFRIRVVASGHEIWHCIEVTSDPKPRPTALGQVFTDYTFEKGGVGLRATNGAEFYVSEQVTVRTSADPQCKANP